MNVDTTEAFTIPDKCRKIGTPGGKYILYVEDYAHTFIRQNLQLHKQKMEFFAYGHLYKIENTYYILIQGALLEREPSEPFGEKLFLGLVTVNTKKKDKIDGKWSIKCDFSNEINFTVEDYYIYYEKNEMMQNCLIQWHEKMEQRENRDDSEIKMKYTRAIQEQHYNEKETNCQRKIYTGVSLLFSILFMVMLVTILNSYHKMDHLQSDLLQLIGYIEKNTDLKAAISMKSDDILDIEPEVIRADSEEQSEEDCTIEQETVDVPEDVQIQNHVEEPAIETAQVETIEPVTDLEKSSADLIGTQSQEKLEKSQIYIVQKGDTLRGILFQKYGSLLQIDDVCHMNHLDNPDDIKEGEELYLP